MIIGPDQGLQAARLFAFLRYGERIAAGCAARQARASVDTRERRFFRMQARQETAHATLFTVAIRLLSPKGVGMNRTPEALIEYRRVLDDSLERHDHAGVILGMQVILEALGELLLQRIDFGMRTRNVGFERIRRIVLAQEQAHHDFGRWQLKRLAEDSVDQHPHLCELAVGHLALVDQMLEENAAMFEVFDEDPARYRAAIRREIPAWLRVPA